MRLEPMHVCSTNEIRLSKETETLRRMLPPMHLGEIGGVGDRIGGLNRRLYVAPLRLCRGQEPLDRLQAFCGICSNAQNTKSVAGCSIPSRLSLDATWPR